MKTEEQQAVENKQIELKGRLNGAQKSRLGGLLNMMYRPSEIAEEIGFGKRQFYRVYIPLGCPHERDSRKHIWVNGRAFQEWYQAAYSKVKLAKDEAFCLTCKQAVKMVGALEKQKDDLTWKSCDCSICNRPLARIIRKQRHDKSQ